MSEPIVEVAEAIEKTICNPSIPVLAEDLLLAHRLAEDVKSQLIDKHPSVIDVFKMLFGL